MQQRCTEYDETCLNMVYQTMEVALPLTLAPDIHVGRIKLKCCGEPQIEYCPADDCCGCALRITQTVTYKIPLTYRIASNVGDLITNCHANQPTERALQPCCNTLP